jgi:hypothetical protein
MQLLNMGDIEIGDPSAKTYLRGWPSVKTYYVSDSIEFFVGLFFGKPCHLILDLVEHGSLLCRLVLPL